MRPVRLGLVGTEDRVAQVASLLRAAGAEPGDVAADIERVVAAGGDGTLGAAALAALRAGVPLAVVPAGTANSFARWLGLPLDLDEAVALATRRDARTRSAEVAMAGERPFVNVAATGLSVLAAHGARPLKRRLGPLAYAAGALRAALTGRPLHTVVRADGAEAWRGDAWQILVAATGAFGGDASTGGVDPHDDRLDVAIVPAGPRARLLRQGYAMRRGRLVHDDDVVHVRGATIELDGADEFNVDGDVIALRPARFTICGRIDVVTG